MTHGNGATTEYVYFPHGPVGTITVRDAASLQRLALSYSVDATLNPDGLDEAWETGTGPWHFGYGYDGADRLTNAQYPTLPASVPPLSSESFGYDPAGNRDDDPANPVPWDYDCQRTAIFAR